MRNPAGIDFRRHAMVRNVFGGGWVYAVLPVLKARDEGGRAPFGGVTARACRIGHSGPNCGGSGRVCCHAILTATLWCGCRALEDLRNSNPCASGWPFPVLVISGVLTGFVFAALRFVMALWPGFALGVCRPGNLAALGALAAGGLYFLALFGAGT